MSAIFICVIVLEKMCLHMLTLCWFKHKKIFECFSYFWKVFCFYKNWKFQKQYCPVLATQSRVRQVACHSRELAGQFWRHVRKWKVQSWGVHKEFRGSVRDSLVGRPSSREKHLEIIFHNFDFECFGDLPWWLVGNSPQSRKTRVWQKMGQFLKTFSVFPWTFYDYSISLLTETHPNTLCHTPQTPFLHHFFSYIQEKCMGFLCLTSFFMFWVCFSWFC